MRQQPNQHSSTSFLALSEALAMLSIDLPKTLLPLTHLPIEINVGMVDKTCSLLQRLVLNDNENDVNSFGIHFTISAGAMVNIFDLMGRHLQDLVVESFMLMKFSTGEMISSAASLWI